MARFWILLLILWYRAFTIVRTEEDNLRPQTDFDRLITLSSTNVKSGTKDDNPTGKSSENRDETSRQMDDNELMNYETGRNYDAQFRQRAVPLNEISNFPELNVYKRYFEPWGGKRSVLPIKREQYDVNRPRKPAFHSWGGKRSPMEDSQDFYDVEEPIVKRQDYKKLPFNYWGGKRTYDVGTENIMNEYVDYTSPLKDTNVMMGRRRLKFNSWGGKRSAPVDDGQLYEALKRTFHAWGGK